jgi:hypothetical protein
MNPPLILFVALLLPGAPAADDLFTDLGFDAARARVGQEKKILVLEVFDDPMYSETTNLEWVWRDREVRKWVYDHAIVLKVDANKEPQHLAKLNGLRPPQIVFVNANGTVLDYWWTRRSIGFVEAGKRVLALPAPTPAEVKRVLDLIPRVTAATPHVATKPWSAEIESTISSEGDETITVSEKLLLDGHGGRRQELTFSTWRGSVSVTASGGEAWISWRTVGGGPPDPEVFHGRIGELELALQ